MLADGKTLVPADKPTKYFDSVNGNGNGNLANRRRSIRNVDLVFFEASPDYCTANDKIGKNIKIDFFFLTEILIFLRLSPPLSPPPPPPRNF